MSAVHASRGPLKPASPHLRSEVDIVCTHRARRRSASDGPVPWSEYRADYTNIRRAISHVVPGCAAYDEKASQPGGFVLPHPPRDSREFPTEAGKGIFTRQPDRRAARPEGRLLLQSSAATTSSTPRSTASATATAASRTGDGWSSCTRTTSRPSASPTVTSSTSSVSGRTAASGRCRRSASSPTTPREAARRRTTRR